MTARSASKPPVLVCRWKGRDDRFFGKYRTALGEWVKIPGGVFPDEINTRTKAEAFARAWYERHRATVTAEQPRPTMTFRQLGEAWTSGKLARDYPDQVKRRRSVADDVSRLEAHVYPVIGHKPVAAVTLED